MKKRYFITKLALAVFFMSGLTFAVSANESISSSNYSGGATADFQPLLGAEKLASQAGKSFNVLSENRINDINKSINEYEQVAKENGAFSFFSFKKAKKLDKKAKKLEENILNKKDSLLNSILDVCGTLDTLNIYIRNNINSFLNERNKDIQGVEKLKDNYQKTYEVLQESLNVSLKNINLKSFSCNDLITKMSEYDGVFKKIEKPTLTDETKSVLAEFEKIVNNITIFVNFEKEINELVKKVYINAAEKRPVTTVYKDEIQTKPVTEIQTKPVTTVYNIKNEPVTEIQTRPVTTVYKDEIQTKPVTEIQTRPVTTVYTEAHMAADVIRKHMNCFIRAFRKLFGIVFEKVEKEVLKEYNSDKQKNELNEIIKQFYSAIDEKIENYLVFDAKDQVNEKSYLNELYNNLNKFIFSKNSEKLGFAEFAFFAVKWAEELTEDMFKTLSFKYEESDSEVMRCIKQKFKDVFGTNFYDKKIAKKLIKDDFSKVLKQIRESDNIDIYDIQANMVAVTDNMLDKAQVKLREYSYEMREKEKKAKLDKKLEENDDKKSGKKIEKSTTQKLSKNFKIDDNQKLRRSTTQNLDKKLEENDNKKSGKKIEKSTTQKLSKNFKIDNIKRLYEDLEIDGNLKTRDDLQRTLAQSVIMFYGNILNNFEKRGYNKNDTGYGSYNRLKQLYLDFGKKIVNLIKKKNEDLLNSNARQFVLDTYRYVENYLEEVNFEFLKLIEDIYIKEKKSKKFKESKKLEELELQYKKYRDCRVDMLRLEKFIGKYKSFIETDIYKKACIEDEELDPSDVSKFIKNLSDVIEKSKKI